MDFRKPIYGKAEGFMEQAEDGYYSGGFKNIIIFKSGKRKNRYFFKFQVMTKEQLEMATTYTKVKFYQ